MGTHANANTGGFALWGGPHILSLVTEVATRALKAVRYQKFNIHLRLRPEALAARVHVRDKKRFPNNACFEVLINTSARCLRSSVKDRITTPRA